MKRLELQKIINQKTKVLLVFAHPDDETPLSGGLTYRISRLTDNLELITLSRGEATTLKYVAGDIAKIRKKELMLAAKALGIKRVIQKRFPDGKLFEYKKEIKQFLKKKVKNTNLVVTYEAHGGTGHPDHILVPKIIDQIYRGQILWATLKNYINEKGQALQKPNCYINLSKTEAAAKLKALTAHKSQFGKLDKKAKQGWDSEGMLTNEYFYLKNYHFSVT